MPIETVAGSHDEFGKKPEINDVTTGGHTWKVLNLLGEGGSGTVYKVVNIAANAFGALKIAKTPLAQQKLVEEANKLQTFKEVPNIVRLIDKVIEGKEVTGLLMSLIEGKTLQSVLEEIGGVDMRSVQLIAVRLLRTIIKLHELGYIHGDIKPANVMLNEETMQTTLIDLGDVRKIKEHLPEEHISTIVPPEAQDKANYICSEKYDVFAFGALLFSCLGDDLIPPERTETGEWRQVHSWEVTQKYVTDRINGFIPKAMPLIDDEYSSEEVDQAKDFFAKVTNFDPINRISAQEALNHPFLVGAYQFVLSED